MLHKAKLPPAQRRNSEKHLIVNIIGEAKNAPIAIIEPNRITEVFFKGRNSKRYKVIRLCLEEKSADFVEVMGVKEPEFYPVVPNGIFCAK